MKDLKIIKVGRSDPQPSRSALPLGLSKNLGGSERDFAFDRINFILLAVGMVVVVAGFLLMSGSGSTAEAYNPDIFSTMRIKVAPVVCFVGFVSMIYAIMRKPKDTQQDKKEDVTA